ncbi:MAG: DUF3098 domain-containing protein [Alistipes sp.]|jgi:uncharacterized membrane protein|nr:DUF3098 domain-containing protein [Alistipes sp.]
MDKNRDKSGVDMPFTKSNYITILAGMVCILLGFVLMSGGGEHTATSFDDTIFSFRRITLAPIVVVAGFVVVGVGIMKRFKSKK